MIQFRQSRTKLTLLTVLFAGWAVAFGFCAVISAYLDGLWPYLSLSLLLPLALAGAFAAVMSGLSWIAPATITAGENGMVFASWRGEQRFAWDRVAEFTVFSPASRLRSPGVELKDGTPKFVSFGRNWEQSAEEIVAKLEAQRALRP